MLQVYYPWRELVSIQCILYIQFLYLFCRYYCGRELVLSFLFYILFYSCILVFYVTGIILGESWFLSRGALCEAIASVCLTSCFCSLLSIGAISLNRYIHICHNTVYARVYTIRNSVCMVVCLWIVSFLMEMPNFIGWGDHVFDRKTLSCVWDRTADLSYSMFFSIAGVAFPVILISICYLKIYIFFKKNKNKIATIQNSVSNAQQSHWSAVAKKKKESKESIRLARTLFVIFVVFVVCWTPYAVIVSVDHKDQLHQSYHIFSILLAHTNSSLNSVLYGLTNRNFRLKYKQLLTAMTSKLTACFPRGQRVAPAGAHHATAAGGTTGRQGAQQETSCDVFTTRDFKPRSAYNV